MLYANLSRDGASEIGTAVLPGYQRPCFMLLKNGRFFVLYATQKTDDFSYCTPPNPKKSRPTTGAAKRISECEWPVKGKKNISKQNNKRANEDAFILLQHAVISVVRALMIPFA